MGEPIAWASTTVAFRRFISETQYQSLRPVYRKCYMPYRCTYCTRPTDVSVMMSTREFCTAEEEAAAKAIFEQMKPYLGRHVDWTSCLGAARNAITAVDKHRAENASLQEESQT
jgi:hypothetical protein